MAFGREGLKTVLLVALLLLVSVLILKLQHAPLVEQNAAASYDCDCKHADPAPAPTIRTAPSGSSIRLLSYQPPGNGWNNQRIAMENALVLAKLLNRTLLVHPLAPHELGNKMKAGLVHGYMAYNKLHSSNLLPSSHFLDLDLMSQVTPVQEVAVSHPEFVSMYSHLTWKNICHTPGYGFWVDRVPQTSAEIEYLSQQHFSSLGRVWREKCPAEKARAEMDPNSVPIIRYVSDLEEDESEMLYFEHGTLFGIHIRFTAFERALKAQQWIVEHVRYSPAIWRVVDQIQQVIGPNFNAIQVRRKHHMDSRLPSSYWIQRMIDKNFSPSVPVYVATNDVTVNWFKPFLREGYKLYFSTNLSDHLTFPRLQPSLHSDLLGIHEQCLCMQADLFVGSPASTFNALILRQRGEVRWKGGLMMDTLHTSWIGHQIEN
jgi:hypothetical protein